MSEGLVVLNNNTALQTGGVGFGAGIFKAKPSMLELVQKTSRQEGVKYGEFRDISSNVHFGSTIRVVLMAVPQEQREWFDGKEFSAASKKCFSLDGLMPHPRAPYAPALYCRACPKSMSVDANWIKWRQTKDAKDLPPCGTYWHLMTALRSNGRPYYLNIKGTSYKPFKQAMETQMMGLMADLLSNARAENKPRGYTYVAQEQRFVDTPGFVLPEGLKEKLPMVPMPNIFDISFDINATSKDGGPFVMDFKKFAQMNPEDKAEFGQLYLDLSQQRVDATEARAASEAAINEDAKAEAEFNEAPSSAAPQGEVLPPITI